MKAIVSKLKNEGALVSFMLLFLFASIMYPKFLSNYNIFNLVREVSMLGLLSIGMTMVIISGGIDLSVGAIFAVASVTVATLSQSMGSVSSVLITLSICTAIGFIMGILIAKFNIEPFIVTLAGMMFGRGLALIVSNENAVKINKEVYTFFQYIGRGVVFGIPVSFIIFLIISIIFAIILQFTQFGRTIYAIGGNESGAQVMGLKVLKSKVWIYTINSFLAGMAGIIMAARLGAGQPSSGNTYELKAILSVVIGGTLITGGVGKISGTVIGIFILILIDNIFNMEGLGTFYRNIILGIILILIVILQKGVAFKKNENK